MRLIADGLRIRPRCGNEEIKRLHTRIAGAFRHNIKEFAVRLRVQLIKHNSMNVEAMLRIRLCRKYLIETVRWQIYHALLGGKNLYSLAECWTHTHHVCCDLKHDARLLTVSGAAINLGTLLPIAAAKKQCNGGREFALPHFLGNLHIRRIELPIPVRLQDAEDITNDALLPVDQLERLPCPRPLRMA